MLAVTSGQGCKTPFGSRTPFAAIAVVLLTLLAGVATGCGGGGSGGESSSATNTRFEDFGSEASPSQAQQAETTLHDYLEARAQNEWKRACSYIAKPIQHVFSKIAAANKQIKAHDCAGLLANESFEISPAELTKLDVEAVRVQGRTGYVIYRIADKHYAISTIHENGDWKLGAAGGTSLR